MLFIMASNGINSILTRLVFFFLTKSYFRAISVGDVEGIAVIKLAR